MRSPALFRVSRPTKFFSISPNSSTGTCSRRYISRDARRGPGSVAQLLDWKPEERVDHVVVNGFVRSVRSMKSACFVSLGDGSSLAPLQAVVPSEQAEGLAVGAAVRLTGSWISSPGRGQSHELHVSQVNVVGPCDAKTYPIQKKYQTPEYLRTLPHLRPRIPHNAALLRLRSAAIASLTRFFSDRDFTQTHTPIITSSDCEGAGEVFVVAPAAAAAPSGEVQVHEPGTITTTTTTGGATMTAAAYSSSGAIPPLSSSSSSSSPSFFRSTKYLTVSAQLHLEALAQSVGNVWTLSPTFRAERSDTSRHLSEFYMLEAEMSFANGLCDIMDLTEDMLRHLGADLHDSRAVQDLLVGRQSSDLTPVDEVRQRWAGLVAPRRWPRISYTEAVSILRAAAPGALPHGPPVWGEGLLSEHERYIAKHVGGASGSATPVFVTDYPRDIKAFYMRQNDNKNNMSTSISGGGGGNGEEKATVECFDLLVPEFCEIAGGSMREHRLEHLLAAMRQRGMAVPPSPSPSELGAGTGTIGEEGRAEEGGSVGALDWYVDLRRWGCPPHGGFGLGFDRLLSYLAGVQTIRDMVAFPRWFGRCDC